MADSKVSALSETSVPDLDDLLYSVNDTGPTSEMVHVYRFLGQHFRHFCHGRLTLTTALPVTTADVTGATTIYFTPYQGQLVSLYDGTRWKLFVFTERSLALGTLTAALPYDVFLYDNAGTPTLELTAWTNTTTRATALTAQDGVIVKTGVLTRRYLGTIYTASTTSTEDSGVKRFVWNMYNRVPRPLRRSESTGSWNYTTATIRQANAAAANQVEVVTGLAESMIHLILSSASLNSGAVSRGNFIGEDSTSAGAAEGVSPIQNAAGHGVHGATLQKIVPVGYHKYTWLEYSDATNTTTWYGAAGNGSSHGLSGTIVA